MSNPTYGWKISTGRKSTKRKRRKINQIIKKNKLNQQKKKTRENQNQNKKQKEQEKEQENEIEPEQQQEKKQEQQQQNEQEKETKKEKTRENQNQNKKQKEQEQEQEQEKKKEQEQEKEQEMETKKENQTQNKKRKEKEKAKEKLINKNQSQNQRTVSFNKASINKSEKNRLPQNTLFKGNLIQREIQIKVEPERSKISKNFLQEFGVNLNFFLLPREANLEYFFCYWDWVLDEDNSRNYLKNENFPSSLITDNCLNVNFLINILKLLNNLKEEHFIKIIRDTTNMNNFPEIYDFGEEEVFGKLMMINLFVFAAPLVMTQKHYLKKLKNYLHISHYQNLKAFYKEFTQNLYEQPNDVLNHWFNYFFPQLWNQNCSEESALEILNYLESLFFYGTNYYELKKSEEHCISEENFSYYFMLLGELYQSFGSIPFNWDLMTNQSNQKNLSNNKRKLKKNKIKNKIFKNVTNHTVNRKHIFSKENLKTKTNKQASFNYPQEKINEEGVEIEIELEKELGKEEEEVEEEEEEEVEVEVEVEVEDEEGYKQNNDRKFSKYFTRKVFIKMLKNLPLLEDLTIFFNPQKTPRLFFPNILTYTCTRNNWIRNKSIEYLLLCLQFDEFCYEQWKTIYPHYIPQSNNLVFQILLNWRQLSANYSLNLKKLNSILTFFIETNQSLGNEQFDQKKYWPNDDQVELREAFEIENIIDNDINISSVTFKQLKISISKSKKNSLLLNFLLFFLLIIVLICLVFFWKNNKIDFKPIKTFFKE
ncbi:cortactin and drebrin [Anaeramoeba flamelloides]|uniref:Cortactin and drebrin n=1 Tax=Anaeramoeba flamelloides TaxID=1746091 RepID=A0AAV7YJ62_9EUKA|nr:cortactin and drebrin [Anaeramoeba flamelloides]